MTDFKLFDRQKEVKKKTTFVRCNFCGKDTDQVFPYLITVGEKTFNLMEEINKSRGNNLKVISKNLAIKGVVDKIDEITCKPINGFTYQVNGDACRNCIDKIGWRHKFNKNPYARKAV